MSKVEHTSLYCEMLRTLTTEYIPVVANSGVRVRPALEEIPHKAVELARLTLEELRIK